MMVYDEAHQRVLLSGGAWVDNRRNYEILGDLWSFDGSSWTRLAAQGDRVSGARFDLDAQKRIVSFAGFRNDSGIGDVRVLENNQWRKTGSHPTIAVPEPAFVFDAARNRFVALLGAPGRPSVTEVWEYDGSRWSRSTATPPTPRYSTAMVYDARRKKIVVFGGLGPRTGEQSAPMLGDTWEFDGTTWTRLDVAGPPARLGAGVAYDSKRGVVLLFGGANHEGVFNDLWSWDGTAWKKLSQSGPEPRVMGYLAYDKKRDRVVMFGGRRGAPDNGDLGDTWEWDGAAWRKFGP